MDTDMDRKFREYVAALADDDTAEAAILYANYFDNKDFSTMATVYHDLLKQIKDD